LWLPIVEGGMNGISERRRDYRCVARPVARGPVIAATLLLFALMVQCFDLQAELVFRSAEQANGQQSWSALKSYGNPLDTAYPRTPEDGKQVPADEVQVFLQGYITAEDVYAAKMMESLVKKGRHRIAGNTVSLASSGGEVEAAMELGRLLRKLGVSTLVAPGEQCLSSCVFAFMGGDRRTVAGRIGIHRPYFSSTREVPDRRVYYRQLQKKLQEFIDELDFPLSLYEAVMAVPPESVSILAPAELKRFYLEGMSPSTQDEADAASARTLGISVVEYLQRKAASNVSAADEPGRQAYEPPVPGAAGHVAEHGKSEADALGASRRSPGSPRAAF
jgi:ATP-dependent protease ClpP protease subunit